MRRKWVSSGADGCLRSFSERSLRRLGLSLLLPQASVQRMPVSCERTRLQSAPFIRRTSIWTNPMEALRIIKLRPKPKFTGHPIFFAERTRFELVVRIAPYVGLANRWFQPLTHLSGHPRSAAAREKVCKYSIFLPNAKEMTPKFRQPSVSWCRRQVCGRSCGRAAFPPADARDWGFRPAFWCGRTTKLSLPESGKLWYVVRNVYICSIR